MGIVFAGNALIGMTESLGDDGHRHALERHAGAISSPEIVETGRLYLGCLTGERQWPGLLRGAPALAIGPWENESIRCPVVCTRLE